MKKVDYEGFQLLEKYLKGVHTADEYGFYRVFKFSALGIEYKFEFFENFCTLYVGSVSVSFTHACIDGCFPNRYKNNLNLGDGENRYCIIPLQEY